MIAFYSYTHWIIEPVFALSNLNKIRQQAVVSFPRLKSFISESFAQDMQDDCGYTMDTIAPIETVTVENMSFSYSESKMIIKDLSLEMKIEDRIAITGESGTRKSNLAKLLLSVIQPDKGEILINETGLDCIDVQSYLSHCSYLPQEIFLFSASLDAEMEEAIIQAVDDYLKQHPCIFIVITHGKPILKICDTELRIDSSANVKIVSLKE